MDLYELPLVLFLNPIPMVSDDSDVLPDVCHVGLVWGYYYPGIGLSATSFERYVFSGTYDECCDYLDNYKSEHGSYIWKEQP